MFKPTTVFEFILGENPILLCLAPYLSIVDICRFTAINKYMRFIWPVKCNDTLRVVKKVLLWFNWPVLPPSDNVIGRSTCEFNLFCGIMNSTCKTPERPLKSFFCIGRKCKPFGGFHKAFGCLNASLSKFTICPQCFLKQANCGCFSDWMEQNGYMYLHLAISYHTAIVSQTAKRNKLQFFFSYDWNYVQRTYYNANFLRTCKEMYNNDGQCYYLEQAIVDANMEKDLKMTIPY